MDRQPAIVDQAVLAEFISEGLFERHIRRTRVGYAERQEVLIKAIRDELPNIFDVAPNGAGMYLVAYLKNGLRSADAARRALAHNVAVVPLSSFSTRYLNRDGLVLGYGAYTPDEIREAVRRLSAAFREPHEAISPYSKKEARTVNG
jgi:GntR family transcriptional regulator/MocR family aminotransferase